MLREPEWVDLKRVGLALDRPTDDLVGQVASRQHGRIAAWQLRLLEVTPGEIVHRVGERRWHRLHRGVYAVGHPGTTPEARRMAAVLAGGTRGLLSHRSLAHHLTLLDGPGPSVVDVTIAGPSRAGQPGLRLHLPRTITRGEVSEIRGIPCTTTERLLADMAAPGEATDAELATLVHRATVKRMIDRPRLVKQLARPADGIGRLRELVEPTGPDLRGKLERRFWAFMRQGGWRGYEANARFETPFGPLLLDAYWRDFAFGIELDSWRHHGGRDSFESDRRRDIAADLIGIDVKRVTWRMLAGTPEVVEALLDHRVGRGC